MKKKYECHDCETQFVLPAQEKPQCPACESGNITFEGEIEPGLLEKFWTSLTPVVQFIFLPWRFFAARSLNKSTAHLLLLLSVTLLFAGYWQLGLALEESAVLGHGPFSVFRNYSFFSELTTHEFELPAAFPAPVLILILLLVWEFVAFHIFGIWQYLLTGLTHPGKTGLIYASVIWLPNIFYAAFMFIIGRGAYFELWNSDLVFNNLFITISWLFVFWLLYIHFAATFTGSGKTRSAAVLPLTLATQFLIAGLLIFILRVYLLPALGVTINIPLIEPSANLALTPFHLLFL